MTNKNEEKLDESFDFLDDPNFLKEDDGTAKTTEKSFTKNKNNFALLIALGVIALIIVSYFMFFKSAKPSKVTAPRPPVAAPVATSAPVAAPAIAAMPKASAKDQKDTPVATTPTTTPNAPDHPLNMVAAAIAATVEPQQHEATVIAAAPVLNNQQREQQNGQMPNLPNIAQNVITKDELRKQAFGQNKIINDNIIEDKLDDDNNAVAKNDLFDLPKVVESKGTGIGAPMAMSKDVVTTQEMQEALSSINSDITFNNGQIKSLENSLKQISKSLQSINQNIKNLENKVLAINENVEILSQDLQNVKRVMKEEDLDIASLSKTRRLDKTNYNKQQAARTADARNNDRDNYFDDREDVSTFASQDYSLHAIIPGRAWLKSQDGQFITVTEGDKLGKYGKVAAIDAASGIVVTSSGVLIK